MTVRAGGGVVLRSGDSGWQVVLVHRPRYDDWSLPKGKVDGDEGEPEAALREVQEETGLTCHLEEELPEIRYRDRKGRRKRVRFWVMRPVAGAVEARPPDREVDRVEWLEVGEARRRMSYPGDRELLRAALAGRASGR